MEAVSLELRRNIYNYIHRQGRGENEPRWRGIQVVKYATDLILYSQVIYRCKPDWIIETGTKFGGSAVFFGDMLSLFGGSGNVLSIDIEAKATPKHPRVQYIAGNSADREVVAKVATRVSGRIMVVLDSDHSERHVRRELKLFSPIVTPGQYLVVEDCYTTRAEPYGPGKAVAKFIGKRDDFRADPLVDQFIFGVTLGGWLLKLR